MNSRKIVTQFSKVPPSWMAPVFAMMLLLASGITAVNAQFTSGSDESDGALDFTGTEPGTTIKFDPAAYVDPAGNPRPLDTDGDNIYHFTSITIPEGLTVRLAADILGTTSVVWLATDVVVVDGVITLSGQRGPPHNEVRLPAIAGAGGYNGGVGGAGASHAFPGDGPGAGKIGRDTEDNDRGDGGGAGHATAGGSGPENLGGPAYGNNFLLPLLGGSGGAGGIVRGGANGGGGGAGGGAFLLASTVSISLNGEIVANGGNGGNGGSFNEGGSGSGGAIRLMSPVISGTGALSANGGTPGGRHGGAPGRIRVETTELTFTGSISPAAFFAAPGLVFLPEDTPALRITKVGGQDVSPNPTGSFVIPDVTIDAIGEITIEMAGSNIPVETVINLRIISESGSIVEVDSTPLGGTLEASTATATATLPHGFSRIFIEASWDTTPAE
ncbi:MAG: hypothetical protein O7E52_08290 [Candidatus Poribacteria bacterium]|nr:hypothetical protein [Candidatus Poribacteria bacterium]